MITQESFKGGYLNTDSPILIYNIFTCFKTMIFDDIKKEMAKWRQMGERH